MDEFTQEPVVDASVDAGQEVVEQAPTDTGETVVTSAVDAPKPDSNVGEAIKREVERRTAALQKQYEEKYAPVTEHSTYLEKRARQEGFTDVKAYLKAIDDLERQQQYERESQRMGVDPDTYAQYFAPVNEKASALEQKVQALESQLTERQQQEEVKTQLNELYTSYPHLTGTTEQGKNPEWFTAEMQDLVDRGYKLVHAYELAHKNTLFQQREQEVLARVTGRDTRQVLPSTDSPNNVQFDPANMSDKQIQELSNRARMGERIVL